MMRGSVKSALERYVSMFLKDTCTIRRKTDARDQHGATIPNAVTETPGVACRVITSKGGQQAQAARIGNRESMVDIYRLIVAVGTDIRPNDLIVIDGATYQVAAIDDKLTDKVFIAATLTRERAQNGG